VDIGDRVKKGATLVELTAPELVEQHRQMQAQVELDRALVDRSSGSPEGTWEPFDGTERSLTANCRKYRTASPCKSSRAMESRFGKAGAARGSAVGEYRVVYRADAECVYVPAAGKRNDSEVCRRLGREQGPGGAWRHQPPPV
jgi:hypothetical protein